MRPLTLLDTIVDECGVPLNGRLKVFVRGETTTSTIYDADGNEIANPQPIVNGVSKRQIFVPDIDVTAEVQVLVDEAFPDDDDSWDCVRRIVDTYPTFDVTNDSDGLYIVGSKSELRTLDPSTVQSKIGVKVVTVLSDSLPPINYSYIAGYGVNDNDGDVINWLDGSRGKWVAMFDKDYVDCRYFGISPKSSYSDITGQDGSRIAGFLNRCASIGKRPYFPAYKTAAYYNIGNNTVSDAKVDVGTVFCNLDGQTASVYDTDVKCFSSIGFGKIKVVADTLRTSLNVRNSANVDIDPNVTVVVDSTLIGGIRFAGITVNVVVDQPNQILFEDCVFIGSGKLENGNNSFTRCEIRESLFPSSYDMTNTTFSNCYSSVDKWTDVGKFLKFCTKNSSKFIDLMGRTFSGGCVIPEGCTVRNANMTGAVYLSNNVKIIDSTVRHFGNSQDTLEGIVVRNSRIYDATMYVDDMDASDSTFECSVYSKDVKLLNCKMSYLQVIKANIVGCELTESVDVYPYQGYVCDFNFLSCVFSDEKQVLIKGDTDYTVSGGSVINCTFVGEERYSIVHDGKASSIRGIISANNVNEKEAISENTSALTTFNGNVRISRLSTFGLEGSHILHLSELNVLTDSTSAIFTPNETIKSILKAGTLIIEQIEVDGVTQYQWKIKVGNGWFNVS